MERERELLLHDPIVISPVADERDLRRVHTILEPEFISCGGNIRDITVAQLRNFVLNDGQVWTASRGNECIACTTIQPINDMHPWLYINNGIAVPQERHKGITDALLTRILMANGWNERYFVISVVTGVFTRLGFSEVVPETLDAIDPIIAQIVRDKLRPEKPAHVFIRIPLETHA